jgi:predicted phosphoribosyltransferase
MPASTVSLIDVAALRDRAPVLRDRAHGGEVLGEMLTAFAGSDTLVLAIPCGGVPVAAALARKLALPLDVAVVSKITLPWNTEAGYGAVAFDGSVRLNQELIVNLALGESVVQNGIALTRTKVQQRVQRLRRGAPLSDLAQRPVILVDDGLASGYTMAAAVEALRNHGARRILVAVPTAHAEAAQRLAPEVEALYCANLREGRRYAVADAYEQWDDVTEDAAVELLHAAQPAACVN